MPFESTVLRSPDALHAGVWGVQPIASSAAIDAVLIPAGAIKRKVARLGGESALGGVDHKNLLVWFFRDESCVAYNERLRQAFQVRGAIFKKWLALGGMDWGVPDTDEMATPDGVGRFSSFNGHTASIYWTPETGANAIQGAIREKWAAMGWEYSLLGYPVSDELAAPDGIGRMNHFANDASIYWTPETGAHVIGGEIRRHWARLGLEKSYLGYPIADEEDFPEGGRVSLFQNGGIYWWPDTGAIDLRDVIVHYTGLRCFAETDESSASDEPYVIMSVSTQELAATFRSPVYGGVDAGESRPDLVEIYRGRPYGININTIVMEHDYGDPDQCRQAVLDKLINAHEAGVEAMKGIPFVGPALAKYLGPALRKLMPGLADAINDLFGLADDFIGSATVTLSARQMVLLAARTQNVPDHIGIGYKVQTPLLEGDDATYRAYYGIIPA